MPVRFVTSGPAPRQDYTDGGALAVRAGQGLDTAHVRADDALHDRQAQPGALPAAVAAFDAVEHIEDPAPFVFRNAGAPIGNIDPQPAVFQIGRASCRESVCQYV